MKFGYWTPTMGGWLRNVDDEFALEFETLAEIARTAT